MGKNLVTRPFARTAEIVVRLTGTPALTDAYLIVQREAAEQFAGYPYKQRDGTLPVAEALVARGDSAASPEDRLRASASCRRGTALADAS